MDKDGDLYDNDNLLMLDFGYSYDGVNCKRLIDLLNELHEEVERFDMFKTTVAMAIQHRINWLKKQCWDNTDRIDELESLKKELKL